MLALASYDGGIVRHPGNLTQQAQEGAGRETNRLLGRSARVRANWRLARSCRRCLPNRTPGPAGILRSTPLATRVLRSRAPFQQPVLRCLAWAANSSVDAFGCCAAMDRAGATDRPGIASDPCFAVISADAAVPLSRFGPGGGGAPAWPTCWPAIRPPVHAGSTP